MGEMVTSDFAKEHQHNALMDCSFLKCVLIIQRHMLLLSLKAELGAFKTCHNAELLCVKWSKWKLLWNEVRFSRLEVATRTRGHGANTAWLELDEGKISPLTSFWKIVISYTSSSTCHRAGTHLRCEAYLGCSHMAESNRVFVLLFLTAFEKHQCHTSNCYIVTGCTAVAT